MKVAVGIPADLLRRGPDVRAAELRAVAQIGVAETELYPAISITGTFGGVGSNVNGHNLLQVFQPIGRVYSGGPSFKWNLLNYGHQQHPSPGRNAPAISGRLSEQTRNHSSSIINSLSNMLCWEIQAG